MRVFGDLFIHHDGVTFSALVEALTSKLPVGWSRGRQREGRLNKVDPTDGACFVFAGTAAPVIPGASLWLFPKDTNTAYVSNIVPSKSRQLSFDEYNAILARFNDRVVIPVAKQLGLSPTLSRAGEVGLRDFVSDASARALERFSTAANKSTGSSHPLDNRRWNDFIVAIHNNGDDLSADVLRRWLIEDGWDPDSAMDLAIEYERGRDLLKQYAEV